MLRNRKYCQGAHNCFTSNDTTCKKNITKLIKNIK